VVVGSQAPEWGFLSQGCESAIDVIFEGINASIDGHDLALCLGRRSLQFLLFLIIVVWSTSFDSSDLTFTTSSDITVV
jgi:hypothetical protein